jgi:uncharacterized protein YecE (DUF72 family)
MAASAHGRVRIGCSGWQYKDWRGRFYPRTLPAAEWLPHYAGTFDTVEVNNTFYRLPEAATFAAWAEATPADFRVAVKASRFLTHLKRLREPAAPLGLLFERALALGRKLGPVLYQLPPTQQYDAARLRAFLAALPARADAPLRVRFRHAIEFRHPSWYRADVFDWLNAAGVALCLHDKTGSTIDTDTGGPFLYVRFHGTSGHYHGSYPRRLLEPWAERLGAASSAGRDAYIYFNNDVGGAAVRNARLLERLVGA